ncbi:aromatic-ring-hydroxylating dioxygenase subunit beta, partial [Acinetobacter baumannii]
MSTQDKATLENIAQFLYREARFLDDEQWDDWLECYAPEASFWMPAWDDDDRLTEDPQSEISLIYYPDRQGLEDRVFRIKTERSSATMPDTRTSHNIANVEVLERDGDKVTVRFNWNTLSFRSLYTTNFTEPLSYQDSAFLKLPKFP